MSTINDCASVTLGKEIFSVDRFHSSRWRLGLDGLLGIFLPAGLARPFLGLVLLWGRLDKVLVIV